jgi:TolB protein
MNGNAEGQAQRDRGLKESISSVNGRGRIPCRVLISLYTLLILSIFVSPSAAVLTITEPVRGTFQLGEWVNLSGMNTESGTTSLFLVGPGLDEQGTMLTDTTRKAEDGHVDSAAVGSGRIWRFSWDTSAAGAPQNEGTYVVYAVTRPADGNSVKGYTYATRKVEFLGRLYPATTPPVETPTPVPTWTRPPSGIEVQVSRDPTDDIPGKFDGRYLVYETLMGSGDSDIYAYDIATGKTTAIATGPAIQRTPAVSGNRVVYTAYEKKGWELTDTDLYLYQISTGETTRITLPGDQVNPRISGNLLVWQDEPQGHSSVNVMLQDLTTGTRLKISTQTWAYRPDISGRKVTWIDRLDTPAIFLYDVLDRTSERITNRTGIQGYPQIDRNRVTWADMRGDDYDIIVLDVGTGEETRVTEGDRNQFTPSVSGDRVAWIDYRNGQFDVYTYNLATGSMAGITNDRPKQSEVQVGGCIVAWADDRNGSFDVYYQELEDCTPPPAAEVVTLPAETPVPTETPVSTLTTPSTMATPVPTATTPATTPVPATTAPGFGFAAGFAGLGALLLIGFRMRPGLRR